MRVSSDENEAPFIATVLRNCSIVYSMDRTRLSGRANGLGRSPARRTSTRARRAGCKREG